MTSRNNNLPSGTTIDQIIQAVRQDRPEDGELLHQYIAHLRLLKKYGCNKYAVDESLKCQAWAVAGKLVIIGKLDRTRFYGLILSEENALEPEVIA